MLCLANYIKLLTTTSTVLSRKTHYHKEGLHNFEDKKFVVTFKMAHSIPSFYSYPANLFGLGRKDKETRNEGFGSHPSLAFEEEFNNDDHGNAANLDLPANELLSEKGDKVFENVVNTEVPYTGNDGNDIQYQLSLLFDGLTVQREELKKLKEEKAQMQIELEKVRDKDTNRLLTNNLSFVPSPDFSIPPSRNMRTFDNIRYVEYVYPKAKFGGDDKMDVYDFIYNLVKAYNVCPLSPNDFERVFTSRLSSPALTLVTGWIKRKFPMKVILNQLYSTFNKIISPTLALEVARVYGFPRKFNTAMVIAELDNISNIVLYSELATFLLIQYLDLRDIE